MSLVAGLVLMMDLRLHGASRTCGRRSRSCSGGCSPGRCSGCRWPPSQASRSTYADPMRFYVNIFFWLKMLMLLLAALNAMAFHYTTYYSVAAWDSLADPAVQREAVRRHLGRALGDDHRLRATDSVQLVRVRHHQGNLDAGTVFRMARRPARQQSHRRVALDLSARPGVSPRLPGHPDGALLIVDLRLLGRGMIASVRGAGRHATHGRGS